MFSGNLPWGIKEASMNYETKSGYRINRFGCDG